MNIIEFELIMLYRLKKAILAYTVFCGAESDWHLEYEAKTYFYQHTFDFLYL